MEHVASAEAFTRRLTKSLAHKLSLEDLVFICGKVRERDEEIKQSVIDKINANTRHPTQPACYAKSQRYL